MKYFKSLIFSLAVMGTNSLSAQNPIVRDQFSADPTARVFNGKVYVFPSHDILAPEGKGLRKDWFCMADYHVFSSENLTDWIDHGMIVSQNKVAWVDSTSYSMWAPDCVERNGKYYFYFPANKKVADANGRKGFGVGVAVADQPEGPYIPLPEPIKGVNGIDPNVFIDKDGQAYIYWAMGNIVVAKLKDNMTELASEPQIIANLPQKGLKEGPFLFERNNIYYLTIPHVENKIERLEYAIGDNPMGPFKMAGVVMDESPVNCWTNHQSFVEYKGQWYLFYHHNDYSPKFDKNRSIRVDSLSFNADGTIRKVTPTLRGVGVSLATNKIEIDRYSSKSETGSSIAFVDSANTFNGWKTILDSKGAWVKYNTVDFGKEKLKTVEVKAKSVNGGILQVRLDKVDGSVIAEVKIPKSSGWNPVEAKVSKFQAGIHNLVVVLKDENRVEVDWVKFE
ncbi:endo-1,4-beta-xylanase A precursor [Aquipluma nitroreducens]|uniref:Endo-1,4-beta-xylanase A n=1 Tax=Aquipluma nitroreducens TaxID=2010828 RepID=A0A5K7S3D2_9BACT|nr:family 43 glycosylhydrolase [Aquipluma nitroreducens]BBE15990.1 endo-1,4-beta-xylanase A precursor [Aquipluma nitroreducens]